MIQPTNEAEIKRLTAVRDVLTFAVDLAIELGARDCRDMSWMLDWAEEADDKASMLLETA